MSGLPLPPADTTKNDSISTIPYSTILPYNNCLEIKIIYDKLQQKNDNYPGYTNKHQ